MPAIFGSGSTVDAAGAIVPPSAVDLVPTPPAVPAESELVPEPVEGQEVPPAGGTVPEPPPAEAPPVEPTAPAPEAEEDDDILPPPGQSRRRFVRELFRRVTTAEQRVPQLEQQNAALTALIHDLRRAPAAPEVPPQAVPPSPLPSGSGTQPRPDAFATHEEYVSALTAHAASEAVRQALAERDQQTQAQRQAWEQQRQQQVVQARQQAWQAKMAEGRQQFENFDLVLGNPAAVLAPMIQPVVVESVLESPHGSAMLHYLGVHPDVTQALNQMSPYAAARLLGEIEAVVRPRAAEVPPTPPPRSQAGPGVPPTPVPQPLQPVGASQAPTGPGQFRQGMSLDAYTRMREAQMQRR